VVSGAAIFTVGDIAAQVLTASQKKKRAIEKATAVEAAKARDAPTTVVARTTTTTTTTKKETKSHGAGFLKTSLSSLDTNRLFTSTVLGAIWSGFCVPYIYGNVEKTFPGNASLKQILTKVLVTCGILSTIGNYATMYARRVIAQYTTYQFDETSSLRLQWFSRPVESLLLFLAILKGCFRSCNHDILEVIVDDLKIWPLYDFTCYGLIPPSWRPVTTSLMSSGWAMYMSVVSAKEEHDDEDEEEEYAKAKRDESRLSAPALSSSLSSKAKPAAALATKKPFGVAGVPSESDDKTKTITVTPLEPAFSTKPVVTAATSETTKRLIAVAGGTAVATDDSDNASHGGVESGTASNEHEADGGATPASAETDEDAKESNKN